MSKTKEIGNEMRILIGSCEDCTGIDASSNTMEIALPPPKEI
jgi:hypothetical protein